VAASGGVGVLCAWLGVTWKSRLAAIAAAQKFTAASLLVFRFFIRLLSFELAQTTSA
jgi:hypothetical protein